MLRLSQGHIHVIHRSIILNPTWHTKEHRSISNKNMIQKTAKLNYDKQYQWAVYYIGALQCAPGFVNITYFITGDGREFMHCKTHC